MLRYCENPPANSLLAPYVRFVWTLSADTRIDPQIVVPDGCPELIFQFGDDFLLHQDAHTAIVQPRAFVFGQLEQAILIQPAGPHVDVLGVRFHPAGLSAFTSVPQHTLKGRMVSCVDLWNAVPEFTDAVPREATVEQFLMQRLKPRPDPRREDLSSRQNRRRFLDAVGLTPKRFDRIQRLQAAMARLKETGLADAALAAGYFDQAHFTRDFRDFTGQTPAQFIREPHAFSDFFTSSGTGDVRNLQESTGAVLHTGSR